MELDDAINLRTSVRYFEDEEVSEEEIVKLIKAAIRAPTASDLENWLFVVFKSPEKREELYRLIAKGMEEYYLAVGISEEKIRKLRKRMYEEGMYRAPVYIAVFINRNVRFLKGRKYDEVEYLWSVESAAMAIQNLMLKAVELGLGTVYIGVTNMKGIEEKVRELAGLGDEYSLVGVIPVGRPSRDIKPHRRKKDVNEVLRML